jgi:hypothetical protein
MVDFWHWWAVHPDGTESHEGDGRFADIADGAMAIGLRHRDAPENTALHVAVHLPKDATPVWFRRVAIRAEPDNLTAQTQTAMHCIGWERDGQRTLISVFEDGSTLLTDGDPEIARGPDA